jgi:hypothetical protein
MEAVDMGRIAGNAPDWESYRGGIDGPNTTATPDVFYDEIFPFLSEVELRVLLYIIRHTFGFKKIADAISLAQLMHGIVTKEGRRLDHGTQLSRAGVTKGLRGLREKHLVLWETQTSAEYGNRPSVYTLNVRGRTPVLLTEQRGATARTSPLPQEADPSATGVASQQTGSTTYRETRSRVAARTNTNGLQLNAKGGCMICSLAAGQHTAECPYHPANRKDTAS